MAITKQTTTFAVIAAAILILAAVFGSFEYARIKHRDQLALHSYLLTQAQDSDQQQYERARLEQILGQRSFSQRSEAAGPLLDQLIACSYWANGAVAQNNTPYTIPDTGGWDYNDFLFYCFYDNPGVAIY